MFEFPFTFHSQVGQARFRAPEVLFRPDLIGEECEGIHEVLAYAIQKSDMDLRRTLYSNIVLSGGTTLIKCECSPLQMAIGGGYRLYHVNIKRRLYHMNMKQNR